MIHVVGPESTAEYGAAVDLRKLMVQRWPAIEEDPAHQVWLIAGAKCHGQPLRDIDILLLATFGPGLKYDTFYPFTDKYHQLQEPSDVAVRSLCVAIELKDHSAGYVRFIGSRVQVRYKDGWHEASEQSQRQVHSVKDYLKAQDIPPPYVTSLLWLRNIPNTQLPPRPHPILGAQLTWDLILNVIGQNAPPRSQDGGWTLDAKYPESTFPRVVNAFTKEIKPTLLDRQRMERVNQRVSAVEHIRESVGHRLVILRGRGGTGKTMHLLQLARMLYDDEGARVLILTYNKALVADIRRLLTILGISDDLTQRSIRIQTVHSFLHGVFVGLDIIPPNYPTFLKDYDKLKGDALELLRLGVLSRQDMEALVKSNFEAFRWDYVFVDEGQDWPDDERDILFRLYSPSGTVVADGVDQLVRTQVHADWRGTLTTEESSVIPLKRCLRMKAGLARFVSAVATHLRLPYVQFEANEEVPGGRVIIVDGSYLANAALHTQLLENNARAGNEPVDMLFCVPPTMVSQEAETGIPRSMPAVAFEGWGYQTWDGASQDVRESYPTEVGQLRIVQYDSSRGLEGWIVVNFGLDDFYDAKYNQIMRTVSASGPRPPISFDDDHQMAHHLSAQWLLIPLTRAMDTLVIHLNQPGPSVVRSALEAATKEYQDLVEWAHL